MELDAKQWLLSRIIALSQSKAEAPREVDAALAAFPETSPESAWRFVRAKLEALFQTYEPAGKPATLSAPYDSVILARLGLVHASLPTNLQSLLASPDVSQTRAHLEQALRDGTGPFGVASLVMGVELTASGAAGEATVAQILAWQTLTAHNARTRIAALSRRCVLSEEDDEVVIDHVAASSASSATSATPAALSHSIPLSAESASLRPDSKGVKAHKSPQDFEGVTPVAKRITSACRGCQLSRHKCDGKDPCSYCQKRKVECVYEETKSHGPKSGLLVASEIAPTRAHEGGHLGATTDLLRAATTASATAASAPVLELPDADHSSPVRIPKKLRISHDAGPPLSNTPAAKVPSAGDAALPQLPTFSSRAPPLPLAGTKRKGESRWGDANPTAKGSAHLEDASQRSGGRSGRRPRAPFVYGVRFPAGDPTTDTRFINSRHEMNRFYRKTAEEEGLAAGGPVSVAGGGSEAGEGAYMHARWSGDPDDNNDAADELVGAVDGGLHEDDDKRVAALRERLDWLHPQLLGALPAHLLFQAVHAPPRSAPVAETSLGPELGVAVAQAKAAGGDVVTGCGGTFLGVVPAALSRQFPGLQVARGKREARERRVRVLAAAKKAILSDRAEQAERSVARTKARAAGGGAAVETLPAVDVSRVTGGDRATASSAAMAVAGVMVEPGAAASRPSSHSAVDSAAPTGVSAERAAALLAMLH